MNSSVAFKEKKTIIDTLIIQTNDRITDMVLFIRIYFSLIVYLG